MAGEVSQDVPTDGILSWYDRTRPMWIDLVGDYAGKELFLVEGDSLLRECFEDERIDFAGKVYPQVHPATALVNSPSVPGFLRVASCVPHQHGSLLSDH